MISNNITIYGTKILVELLWDLAFFPIWWYTQGLFELTKKVLLFLNDQQKGLALLVWIKNIHKPMYGQNDWQGILISVIMRIFQILLRSIIMLFWVIVVIVAIIFWIFIPFICIYFIYYQLF